VRAVAGAALAALLLSGGLVAIAGSASAAAAASGAGGCDPYVDGTIIPVPCSTGGGSGGGGGGGGNGGPGGITNTCTTTPLDEAQAKNLGLSWPPPKGQEWALLDCLGGNVGTGPQAVLVNIATGQPQITPQQLLETAIGELQVPYLSPRTAPPRGHDGLVGLPEWFWIPRAEWGSRSVTVTAGTVWATATATPAGLTLEPGGGLSPVSCAGPGTRYDTSKAASAQSTNCSYTYQQPSSGQPGGAYQATLTVSWRVSWTGSGGAGGLLDPALPVSVAFAVPVAQGEALVNTP
jgi:hypothetical protein